jgi:hypothetical protein
MGFPKLRKEPDNLSRHEGNAKVFHEQCELARLGD